jgi:hypothetical protein
MEEGTDLKRLAEEIHRQEEELLARWIKALGRRSWTLREKTPPQASDASEDAREPLQDNGDAVVAEAPEAVDLVRERCRHFLQSLEEALSSAQKLQTGAPELRESVQILSFTAGWMAGAGLPVTDAVALIYGLQEVLDWEEEEFFQSLMVLVTEAYTVSRVQKEQAHFRDAMEKSQLVCDPHPQLPCLFLVGDPDRQAVDDAVGRVMMLAAMREAPLVVVDGSALMYPEKVLPQAYLILAEHGQAASIRVLLSGVPPALGKEMEATGPVVPEIFEILADAMKEAISGAELSWTED